ncbi:MAG: glycosyl transferase, partial [Gammaproteobacteria bacterium]
MTTPSLIIVSGGDSNYFPLLADLVTSIRNLPEGQQTALGMLDGGLTQDQIATFEADGVRVVKPDWPTSKMKAHARGREHLLINLNTPALDLLFPEYDIILWLDGDTWVQTWDAVPLFAQVAGRGKLAVVSGASRLQVSHIRMRRRLFGWVEPRGILFKNARRAKLPAQLAWSLVSRPVLNAGAYALRRDAPHWGRWRAWQSLCLHHGRPFTSDQLALALTVYEDGQPYEALPE